MNNCLKQFLQSRKLTINQKDVIELFVFENMYEKIFCREEDEDCRSQMLYEKLQVLQNLISPNLLQIPKTLRVPSILLQLQKGKQMIKKLDLQMINEMRSPLQKLQIIKNIFDNITSKSWNNGRYFHKELKESFC